MSFVLGIDTGGTYTDGVVIDRAQHRIISKAKSLTTRENLSLGITDVIHRLNFDESHKIDFIALSTTLATNAIVEGRGCEVGLITIGYTEHLNVPAKEIRSLPGGHDIRGNEKEPFDEVLAREVLESLRGKVDALAISSYLSVRNPEHEIILQRMAKEILGLHVVCAHHLTRSLGVHERSVTAILNARLIPIIEELLVSVKKSLAEKAVFAPIMIVKGDGSLMGETQAMDRPIETVLSGPAASIIGANFLAGEKNGMVLDMGGTTSDLAVLKNGMPKINKEGARVGGWLTRVEAAEIDTYGLGGDSYIQKDSQGNFKLGPRRVWPICVMTHRYPHLLEELSKIKLPRTTPLVVAQITDCYILLDFHHNGHLSEREKQIIGLLKDGPHSIFYIARALDLEVNMVDPSRLVEKGIIGQISLTPTDIMHAKGLYNDWNTAGAKAGVALLAERFNMAPVQFCDFIIEKVTERLAFACWQSLLNHEGCDFNLETNALFAYLSKKQLETQTDSLLNFHISPKLPIIGIGAPVRAYLPMLSEKLGVRLVIPEHTEVANAVGAAVGKVMEIVRIHIQPGESYSGYVLSSEWECKNFETLVEAVDYGKRFAIEKAERLARENGVTNLEVILEHRDIYADTNGIANDFYIESHIEAMGTEKSEWL
ncbi:hydantoinase/oxoprolinase family protein [Acidaminobacter sp.]|uniref:hydantoinase/oxoprolinase family protein n=1 Tax=Acidaminobacter sp. TaxID=1872102 RepID=UPI001380E816|nr:hydantoinase/oxoprolinase family protein [Acidaminobacter sp.]MDK9711906.1 hydantoinase/oxoprolinase family protein [Acidaminobacter sp.]MZQ97303.1 hydantoinase/oxoprolinase family protein [Acidaminobacter sp.]